MGELGDSNQAWIILPLYPLNDVVAVNATATSQKGWLMPKALCLVGLVLSILVFLIFALDLILGLSGMVAQAPFRSASPMVDVIFMVGAAGLSWVAWSTFREQK